MLARVIGAANLTHTVTDSSFGPLFDLHPGHWRVLLYNYLHTQNLSVSKIQLSGLLFCLLPLYAHAQRTRGRRVTLGPLPLPYTPPQQCADVGLGLSSLLFWNYVMCHDTKGVHYGAVVGIDYAMIGTNVVVSSCTGEWAARPSACVGTAATLCAHYVHSNGLTKPAAFRAHVYLCAASLAACAWRRGCAPSTSVVVRWAWVIRIYTASVCTLFYYGCLRQVKTMEDFRRLKWWMPWVWHGHALASIVANRVLLTSAQ